MTSLPGSSLEPTEDSRFSILSTQDVKRLLKGIEDNTHLLKEIEDNTHPDRSNRSVSRHNRREKVIVEIRTTIISVGDIDTVGQQFKCDFYLSATWQEPQLQGRSPTEEIKWHNEWHPMIVFFNAVEIGRMEKNHYLFYELGNEIPLVVETCRIKGTFRGNLNLLDFPLDYQQLTITLMSEWTNKLVEFRKNLRKADTIRSETFTADQEWYLCEHVVTEAKITKKTKGSSENDYPLYDIKCHVKRKSGYYLWNSAMIIFLIYMLSFCSFSVEISSPSDRLSVTLTLLLTAVAFKFVVLQSLPTISYLTLLDKYVLSGLVFLSCMAIENAVAASILDPDTQKRFDRICLYFGIGCFLFIHILAVAFVIKKLRTRNKKLADSEEHFKEMRQRVKELERKGSRSNNNNNKNQHRSKEDLPQCL